MPSSGERLFARAMRLRLAHLLRQARPELELHFVLASLTAALAGETESWDCRIVPEEGGSNIAVTPTTSEIEIIALTLSLELHCTTPSFKDAPCGGLTRQS
jgi:hypothetical protein